MNAAASAGQNTNGRRSPAVSGVWSGPKQLPDLGYMLCKETSRWCGNRVGVASIELDQWLDTSVAPRIQQKHEGECQSAAAALRPDYLSDQEGAGWLSYP